MRTVGVDTQQCNANPSLEADTRSAAHVRDELVRTVWLDVGEQAINISTLKILQINKCILRES